MLNALQSYQYDDRPVRVVMVMGEPWFVANDLCAVLALSNPRDALAKLDEDERGVALTDTLGGQQSMNIVSESGLYNLIFRSRKEEAQRFRRWVTGEVLPSIRKHGRYELFPPDDPPQLPSPALDDAQLGSINTAIGIMREARQIWGREECRTIWIRIGLPSPIADASASATDDFADAVARVIADKEWVTAEQVSGMLGLAHDARTTLRIGAALRLLGWMSRTEKVDRACKRVWRRIPRVIHGIAPAGGEA